MIPFLDMKARNTPLKEEYMKVIGEVIDSGDFSGGSYVEQFEQNFAKYCGSGHAVGVGSGTEALWLTMLAMGIGPGDEVITVPMSFVATAEAICQTGAKPVFVDIDEHTYTMDPNALEAVITPLTKAIIPVHLFGQVAEMDTIMGIARRHGILIIEDAAQAHGAEYKGRKAGSFGGAGCFSFYPGKNLGAFGEAGAVVTDDAELASRLRRLRNHGQSSKNRHSEIGWNCRMDGIQAAVLSLKIAHLDRENELRRNHARIYDKGFDAVEGLTSPEVGPRRTHVYHVYAIRVLNRPAICRRLEEKQIAFSVHYPVPIHLQEAFQKFGWKTGDFPVSEQCANEFISLPVFPEMTFDQASDILIELKAALTHGIAA